MLAKLVFSLGGFFAGVGCGRALANRRIRARFSFQGRSVLITGGSRGLGLVLARQLAKRGARLAILARRAEELNRAEQELRGLGATVEPIICDVSKPEQVREAVNRTLAAFGAIDVLINNAGVIQVGPFEHMTVQDFEEALAVHLYGPLFTIMAALPYMRKAGQGRIVNISSVGGKIAVPHLLPYVVSKFALVGLSDGLRAELRKDNIYVTTVCPGLMRTGSARNAVFKGKHRKEYAWFAVSDSLPLLSVSAEYAARRILRACSRGSARLLLGAQTKFAVLLSELLPGAHSGLSSLAHRLLPSPEQTRSTRSFAGHQSGSFLAPSWLTHLSEQAALRNNEIG